MGNTKLEPNTTQIPHLILREWMPKLSDTELRVLLVITDQTLGWVEDSQTKRRKEKDWLSYIQLIEKTGRNREAIAKAIKSLESKNLIEVLNANGDLIAQGTRSGKQLFYRLKTSSESEQVAPNQFGNRNSEIEHTKETNTKEFSSNEENVDVPPTAKEVVSFGNEKINRILEEFREITGLKKPADNKPRQWAFNFDRSYGADSFRGCLEFLQNGRGLTITKLETVYRQFPLYERERDKQEQVDRPEPFRGFG